MTAVLSKLSKPSDIKDGYLRPQASRAHRFDDASDADIRNLVEGYRSEAEVIADAEASFDAWWAKVDGVSKLGLDGFALWRAYKAGWVSMAREVGQLPSLGAS
ncbi:hypothetical protein [Shinella sp.]|uniref:hypothetical protein n=1 Tax=Shinella sp. TaxID=1870904 RepID=UPI0025897E1E|nr:hypothetical protein [Shinella sp.]MCW5711303.1 hypothetical protein [Shinella sp.]